MANNFNWVNATTLNGTLWDNGTLSSVTPITQIGTLTIGGSYDSKYLNAQLNNTGTIVDNHSNYSLDFQNGAILNNSGIYELQRGLIDNYSSSSVGTFNNSGTFKKTTANTATIGVAFNNTGTVNVELGTLNLYGGGVSNGGTFNLTSGQTLQISNSVYTFSNGAKINGSGNLLVSGGTLQTDGNWTLPTISTWNGGTFKSSNIITNSGTLTIGGSYDSKYLNAQLNNTGTIVDNHSNYSLDFQNGAILNNSGIYELQRGLIDNYSSSSVGTFNNSGTFKKTTANTATIGVAFNNTGTVNVELGTLNLYGGGVSNGGTFNLTSGQTLQISNSVYTFSNGAKINGSGNLLVSGGTLQTDGNWTLPTISTWNGGTFKSSNIITNSGTLTIGGSYDSKYLNAQLNNTGTIVDNHSNYSLDFQNGAILNNSGIYELQRGLIDNYSSSSVGTFNNSGTFKKTTANTATIGVAFNNTGTVNVELGTLNLYGGGVSNGGTFNLTSGQTLQISNSVYTFSNGAKINGSGNLLVSGGTLQTDGNWTLPTISTWNGGTFKSSNIITNSGTLTIGGSYDSKYLNAQLNNTGTIVDNHSNYSLDFQNGAILNNSGIYELQRGLIDNYSNSSVGTFNNSGTFKKTTANTATIGVAFNNTGTVNVELGTLNLYGGGVSNGGTFNLTSGQTLQISNSVYTFSNGAKINGSGNLLVSGGTLQTDGNWTLPTISTWNGGTFKSSNIITNSGTLTIGGSYDSKYLNAQLNNTGTIVDNHSNYSLDFQNGAILNNSGIYELQQGLIDNYSSSSVGTFNNSGTFKKTTTNAATIGVAFNNTGTVEANLGSLNFSNTYTQNNANLVLKGGTVTFSNALNINGGSIEGNGSINVGVTNSGLLNPRYASNTEFGRLTINSNYTETNSARINIQLGGSTAGTNFDQVDINGTATFDGTLNVSLLNSFSPTLGSAFDVMTYDSLSLLSNLDFTGLDINSTLQFLPQWFNDKLTLKVVNKSTVTNINVTTNQDVVNASDGVLSLREAVIEANQNSLDNTIILGAQTYALNFSGSSDDNLAVTGDLDLLPRGGRLTIQGQGANQTFITATNLANLFQIHPGATINFSNVTVINSLLNDTVSVSKNVPLNLNVLNNDKSLKSPSISLDSFQSTSVKGGTITRDNNGTPTNLSDDRLIYNPVAGFTGQDSFTYNITDGLVKEQATVTLNVANDAPPAINERLNTPINTAITFAILTNNIDYNGDIINFESFQNSSTFGGTISKVNNQLTYTPKADFSGPDTFSYNINDGFLTTQSTVTVLVNAPPNAVITTTQDTINYTDGLLSLREAIIQANSANIDSKITLGEGTYALAINGANEDLAATGDLDIKLQNKTLTIQGQGKNKTILDANSLDRFFQIHSGATVILSGVTINKGLANYGGALANNGTLTILDSDFVNNQSIGAKGANGANGADGENGYLILLSHISLAKNATAGENGENGGDGGDGKGGGIYNSGTLTISNSLIENNKVTGGQGGIGGNGGQGGVTKYADYSQSYEPDGINGSNGSNGNAYAGAIYNENTGSIVINGGQFVNNVATPTIGGTADNGDVNGIYNNGGTVVNNGSTVVNLPLITLAVSPTSVLEDGTTNLVYTFTRTRITTNALTVNYSIAGTANSADYTGATPGTGKIITFAANSATATLTIDPTADTTIEANETVALTLVAGTGYTLGTTTAVTGTITNDDTNANTLPEVEGNNTFATAQVIANTSFNRQVVANIQDLNGSNISTTYDHVSILGTGDGTFDLYRFNAPANTQLVFDIDNNNFDTILGLWNPNNNQLLNSNDDGIEIGNTGTTEASFLTYKTLITSDYVIGVYRYSSSGAIPPATGDSYTLHLSMSKDDVYPSITLAVAPITVLEDGTTNLVYTFTRTGITTNALTVNYSIAGTADSTDYTGATPGTGKTITFAANSATAILTIDPTADTTIEANETVALTLVAGTGYTLGTTTAVTGTITSDDLLPSINLSANQTIVEGFTSPQNLSYTVTLSSTSTQSITVQYATVNGTSIAGSDYTSTSGTLTFNPGVTSQVINIPILNDSINEANETFTLTLSSPTNANLGTTKTVTTTITDTLTASATTTLLTNIENLTLTGTAAIDGTGNAGNNVLTGNAANNILDSGLGNDTLNGGLGIDTLIGGIGNDIYVADTTTDIITENANEGTDTIQSSVTFSLATLPNIENLTLTGTAAINGTGNAGNNVFTGNAANNILDSGLGNDTLNGGLGIDTLIGGTGNDIYVVDTTTDIITENANEGTDTIQSSVTFSLATLPNIENLTLTGTAAINGTGNTGNNVLTGNAANNILDSGLGNDTLNGGLGIDTLIGGTGNDIYVVDTTTDVITENANEGTDTIQSSVTFSLATLPNIENLTLTGTAAINGTGNAGNNVFTGNAANNILDGGAGNDILNGGLGIDTLIGGTGIDRFDYRNLANSVFNSFDVITDFNANAGNDLFLVATARSVFSNAGTVATLDITGITTNLTTVNFGANAASQFTFGSRTFVAINNATAGFNATTDAIVEVTGLTGTLGISNFTTTLV